MSEGYVYILTNESMPWLVKIGRSKHGGRVRAKDMYAQATGVPTPFKMVFEIWSEDCIDLEKTIHEELQDCRVSEYREFFRIDVEDAVTVAMRCYGYGYNLHVGQSDMLITEDDLMVNYCMDAEKLLNDNFAGIPPCIPMATAIGNHLSHDAVSSAITAYINECEERKNKLHAIKIVGK